MPSDTAHCAACRAGFEGKTGAFIKRKRPAIIDCRRYRTADRTAKNQRDYYSGKAHACTIKTEVVIAPNGQILRVSKPYEGSVHDFKIRKTEGPLPTLPILADSGYQGLQNEHSAAVILPKKKPKNGSLSSSEQARNTKLARCRIAIEHTFAHLKKWHILAARYRGHLDSYSQVFHTIAGIYNLSLAK